jgi:uridine kinase
MTAPADAVLLFDGVFLMRPELIDRWDLRIFVSAAFEKTLDRAPDPRPDRAQIRHRGRTTLSQPLHTVPQFYADTVRPTDHADIIVHNDDPQQPAWDTRPH